MMTFFWGVLLVAGVNETEVLELTKSRLDRIKSLHVEFRVSEHETPDRLAYESSRERSAKTLGSIMGIAAQVAGGKVSTKSTEKKLSFWFDREFGERTEIRDEAGAVVYQFSKSVDGCKTLIDKRGVIHAMDKGLASEAWTYLGLDFPIVEKSWPVRVQPLLTGLFRQAIDTKAANMLRWQEKDRLAISFESSMEAITQAGGRRYYLFAFDPARQFALSEVHIETFYRETDTLRPSIPRDFEEYRWEYDAEEDEKALFPRRMEVKPYFTVMHPRKDRIDAKALNSGKIESLDQFEFEQFSPFIKEVVVTKLEFNTELSKGDLAIAFPDGTVVFDEIRNTGFQVGESNPVITAAIAKQFGRQEPKDSSSRLKGALFLGGLSLVVLTIFLFRRKKA